jgi:hypothetical protein
MKAKPENLLATSREEQVFIDLERICARWGGLHRSNAKRILNKAGIKPSRLTNRTVLYALSEIVALEEAARDQLPTSNLPHLKKKAAQQKKELAK